MDTFKYLKDKFINTPELIDEYNQEIENVKLTNAIRELRIANKLTQRELAKLLKNNIFNYFKI